MQLYRLLAINAILCGLLALSTLGCGGSKPETSQTPPPTKTEAQPTPKTVDLPPPPLNPTATTVPTTAPELPEPAQEPQSDGDPIPALQEMVEAINSMRGELRTKTLQAGDVDAVINATGYYDGDALLLVHILMEGPWGKEENSHYWHDGHVFYIYTEEHVAEDMDNPDPGGQWFDTTYGFFFDNNGVQIGGFSESTDPSREMDEQFIAGILEHAEFARGELEEAPIDDEKGQRPTRKAKVTGDGVRIRNEPNTEGTEVLGKLDTGDIVTIMDDSAEHAPWKLVISDKLNLAGWMHGDYLEELPQEDPESARHPLWERFANMAFPTTYTFEGLATLQNGVYEDSENYVYIRLAPQVYEGDMNGNGRNDAVVILHSNTGGSGMFVDLYAFENTGNEYTFAGTQFMGDRVQIKNVRIEDQKIYVDMITHGEEDPLCCPTRSYIATLNLMGPGSKPSPLHPIKVGSEGIGGLGMSTRFDPRTIAELFPAFEVDSLTLENEGGILDIIMLTNGGQIVAELYPTEDKRIFSVVFFSGYVLDENGVHLGKVYTENPLHWTMGCVPGEEEFSGLLICESPEMPNIKYAYRPMHYDGPDGQLPPREVVEKSILRHIIWIPERNGNTASSDSLDP